MALTGLIRVGLASVLFTAATPLLHAQENTAPTPPPAEATPPPAEAAPTPPADGTMPPPEAAPAPAPEAAPAPAVTTPAPLIPATTVPDLNTHKDVRASLPQRIFMDGVSGLAGAAVILVLGWAVAVPLALLPWVLAAIPAANSLNNAQVFGVPISVLLTAGAVGVVLVSAIAAGAAIQRVVRPLLGPEPSFLGPVLGAVFFGGVGGAIGLVGSYLLVTSPPEPFRQTRDNILGGDISTANGRALGLTAAITVALAVPLAAIGAGVGGAVSAEVEDSRAADASATANGVTGGPVRN